MSSLPQLNDDQQRAIEAVFSFLFSEDKEFIVSGPAGTGKTFLMKHIMKDVLVQYEAACKTIGEKPKQYEIVLTATTNKAAEVLTMATGFPSQTIHSFMNLTVKDNYKTGQSEIQMTQRWTVHRNKLIFIDEASMIDAKLHEYILKGTDQSCKIIYVGDHCQMAPVFETISPVYKKPKYFVTLEKPMRNAGQPALMAVCSQLRQTVETLQFFPIQEVPGVIDYVDPDQAQAFIDRTFASENPDARILCYSNARVQRYNAHIRELRGYPATFTEGERLICNSAFQYGKDFLRVEQEVKVGKVLTQPYDYVIDTDDKNARIYIYDLELELGSGLPLHVRIPVDYGHLRNLSNYYARIKDWTTFYKLKNTFPDLRMRDAATVYKAQGSTYHTSFLDLHDIGKCNQADQLARMLYVGASRATDRLVLYGQVPERLLKGLSNAA